MKRHHVVAVGGLAAAALLFVLWPRSAETPTTGELPATDDPMMNPDAPQGTDRPLHQSNDAGAAERTDATPGMGRTPDARSDAGVAATDALTPTDDAGGLGAATPTQSEADKRTAAMNQDPRFAAYKAELKESINRIKPQIKECYETALVKDPSMAGSIKVTFEIKEVDGGGKLMSGEVPESEIRSPFFEQCILQKIAGADFPAPLEGGTTKVTYPFHFDPGGGWGGDPARR